MNNPKSKRPPGETGMSSREIEASIRRIEDDLYFSSDNIKIRLTRIEEKLEHVTTRDDLKAYATKEDLKAFATREDLAGLRTEMITHTNTLFRWTIGVVVSCMGVILTVMKLT